MKITNRWMSAESEKFGESTARTSGVAILRGLAYTLVVSPALMLAPGCSSEPATPPAGAPTDEETQSLDAPDVEMPDEGEGSDNTY